VKQVFVFLEIALCFLALALTGLFANNNDVERLAVGGLVVALVVGCSLVRRVLEKDLSGFGLPALLVNTVAGYFVWRAMSSPVSTLANLDLLLIASGVCVFNVLCSGKSRTRFVAVMPWFATAMIFAQCAVALYQFKNPEFMPFRESIHGKVGVSGFLGHRNFFSGYVAALSTYLLAELFWGRTWVFQKLAFGSASLLGAAMVFASGSRSGGLALCAGIASLLALSWLVLLMDEKKKALRMAMIAIPVIVVGVIGALSWAKGIVDERGLDAGFFDGNSREDMAFLAMQSEPENSMIGGGSRFYSYESLRVWDYTKLNNTLQSPEFCHNEWLQAWVDYGVIGVSLMAALWLLIGIVCFVGVLRIARSRLKDRDASAHWVVMLVGGSSVLAGLLVHSALDFNLHIMPLVVFGGVALALVVPSKVRFVPVKYACSILSLGSLVTFSATLVAKAFPQAMALPSLLRSQSLESGKGVEAAEAYENLAERGGSYLHYRYAAAFYKELAEEGKSIEYLKNAHRCFKKAVEVHPFDGLSLLGLGELELKLAAAGEGSVENAGEYLTRALHWVGGIEHKCGARVYYTEWLLVSASQAQKAGDMAKAKELYDRGVVLLTESHEMNFRRHGGSQREFWKWRVYFNFSYFAQQGEKAFYNSTKEESLACLRFAQEQFKQVKRYYKPLPVELDRLSKRVAQQVAYLERQGVTPDAAFYEKLVQHESSLRRVSEADSES